MLHFFVTSTKKTFFTAYCSGEQTLQKYPQTTTMKSRHDFSLRCGKTHLVKAPLDGLTKQK